VAAARLQMVVMCMTVSYVLLIQNHGCVNSTNIKSLNRTSLTRTGQTLQAAKYGISKNGKLEGKKDSRLSSSGVVRILCQGGAGLAL